MTNNDEIVSLLLTIGSLEEDFEISKTLKRLLWLGVLEMSNINGERAQMFRFRIPFLNETTDEVKRSLSKYYSVKYKNTFTYKRYSGWDMLLIPDKIDESEGTKIAIALIPNRMLVEKITIILDGYNSIGRLRYTYWKYELNRERRRCKGSCHCKCSKCVILPQVL
jgi:hypothetical protein